MLTPNETMKDLTVVLEHKSSKLQIEGRQTISSPNDPNNFLISIDLFPGKYTLLYKVNQRYFIDKNKQLVKV